MKMFWQGPLKTNHTKKTHKIADKEKYLHFFLLFSDDF
jgi:hypothetical protein